MDVVLELRSAGYFFEIWFCRVGGSEEDDAEDHCRCQAHHDLQAAWEGGAGVSKHLGQSITMKECMEGLKEYSLNLMERVSAYLPQIQ